MAAMHCLACTFASKAGNNKAIELRGLTTTAAWQCAGKVTRRTLTAMPNGTIRAFSFHQAVLPDSQPLLYSLHRKVWRRRDRSLLNSVVLFDDSNPALRHFEYNSVLVAQGLESVRIRTEGAGKTPRFSHSPRVITHGHASRRREDSLLRFTSYRRTAAHPQRSRPAYRAGYSRARFVEDDRAAFRSPVINSGKQPSRSPANTGAVYPPLQNLCLPKTR
jgi:hypothetical protein